MPRREYSRQVASASQSGVILIEVLVAVLIFSIGILSIIALQAFSIDQVTNAKYRLDASMIANQQIARMWVDQAKLPDYVTTAQSLPDLPNGKLTIALAGTNAVTVTVTWTPPNGAETHTYSQVAIINSAGS